MYYIRIPAHEIEKNVYVFINGHNQFDTKKWRLQEMLRKSMSMYVILNGQKAGSDNCQDDMHFWSAKLKIFCNIPVIRVVGEKNFH